MNYNYSLLNESVDDAMNSLNELIKKIKNGDNISYKDAVSIVNNVNEPTAAKNIIFKSILFLGNISVASKTMEFTSGYKHSAGNLILAIIVALLSNKVLSDNAQETELKTFYTQAIKKIDEEIHNSYGEDTTTLVKLKKIFSNKLSRLDKVGTVQKFNFSDKKIHSEEVNIMSGFLDELELLDENKEVSEKIPGSGMRRVTSSAYMERLPEHQSEDLDTECAECKRVRKIMEPGLERPVISRRTQRQVIPGNGIREISSAKYMAKLPELQDIDSHEPTRDTACTLRPFGENTVSQATPIAGGNIETSVDKTSAPIKNPSIKKISEYDEDLIEENESAKKYAKKALMGGITGAATKVGSRLIIDKVTGKKSNKKQLVAQAVIGAAAGATAGVAHEKFKSKKSESFEVEIDDGYVFISESTMEYLLEECNYELTEDEIMSLVVEAVVAETIPGNGIKNTTSAKYMAKMPQYQSVEESKPRKEDGAYLGRGSIVRPHDVSDADEIEDDLADDCLDEEFIYEYDPEIMKIYMEATDYEYSALEICQMIDEATMMDDIEDGYHRLKEKNPTLAGAVKGLAYASTGGLGGAAYGIHKKRRAKREGKDPEKWGVAKRAAKGMGYALTGVATGGLGAAAIGAIRGKSKNNKEKAEKYDEENKKKSESAELAVSKKVQKQQLPGDGIKDVDPESSRKFKSDADEPTKDQQFEESTDIDIYIFNPIKLNENEVRITEQYGKYLISESDYESLCYNYANKLNGYEVLDLVAEANNINVDDLYIMITEGEAITKKACKKAMSCKGSSDSKTCAKRIDAKIARLQAQLKDTAPSSATAKELRRKIKELRNMKK